MAVAQLQKTLEIRNLLVKQVNTRLAPKLHTDGRPPYASVSNFPYVCNCLIKHTLTSYTLPEPANSIPPLELENK